MNNIEQFNQKGYCIVKSAISDELRDFVSQYTLFDELQDFSPDKVQVQGAHAKYADPAMETVLLHLHKTMEENTGLALFPTYSYYRVYRNGDELAPHTDRPSCEISCTLCFNYSYDDENFKWPIFMDGSEVILEPGDMVIYRGCDLKHWRNKFDPKELAWHIQGFFHYVDQNGPYSEFKYDRRPHVGYLSPQSSVTHNKPKKNYITYTDNKNAIL
jgi:hypothetical protein